MEQEIIDEVVGEGRPRWLSGERLRMYDSEEYSVEARRRALRKMG